MLAIPQSTFSFVALASNVDVQALMDTDCRSHSSGNYNIPRTEHRATTTDDRSILITTSLSYCIWYTVIRKYNY